MPLRHGVYTAQNATAVSTINAAASGIPFVIGVAPLSSAPAATRAAANTPVLATSYAEAEAALGYDDDWTGYTLCEFMHYHFKLAASQPVIFLPLPETIQTQKFNGDGTATQFTVTAKPNTLRGVTVSGAAAAISSYDKASGKVTLEAAPAAGSENVVISYLVPPETSTVAAAVEKIDLCMPKFGIVPDIIAAPGFSHESTVAAAMATKAGAINGLFRGKAVVDLNDASYTAAVETKNAGSFTEDMIVCWPMCKLGNLLFHASTVEAGRMAATDTANAGTPYESPSNKAVSIDALCNPNEEEILLTLAQANTLNGAGICTFLNFMGAWKAWGNYTGCYPTNADVKDYFIPVSRMFDWIGNALIKTFWYKLDNPMNRRLIDNIMDSANIWLNGLTGRGYLLGGRVEMLEAENSLTDLMAGILHIHVYITPPSPAQEINFTLEYDAAYVQSALTG